MFGNDDLIHRYTRAQAISDGVPVDVSELAREGGFKVPVAMTAGAWAEAVAWNEKDTADTGVPQDVAGRLWDVVWMASLAACSARDRQQSRVPFTVLRVPRGSKRAQRMTLDMMMGPGDEGEPVMTILLQDED